MTKTTSAILRDDDVAELHDELVSELQAAIGADGKFTRRQLLRATAHRLPEYIRKEMAERVGPAYSKMLPRFAEVKSWSNRAANSVYHHSAVELVHPIGKGQPQRYRFVLHSEALR